MVLSLSNIKASFVSATMINVFNPMAKDEGDYREYNIDLKTMKRM